MPGQTGKGELLTTAEVAQKLGITPQTVRWHVKRGSLKARQFGGVGRLRFDPAEVEKALEERH